MISHAGDADPEVVLVDSVEARGERCLPRSVAHQAPGVLHLAVSIQLIDPDGALLIQRRATSKPIFSSLWANSCCTHPLPGESPRHAADRRVQEELGFGPLDLVAVGSFRYRAADPVSGLVEHELDHVFVGIAPAAEANPDPAEVDEVAVLPVEEALRVVDGPGGAPWAGAVVRRALDEGGRWLPQR